MISPLTRVGNVVFRKDFRTEKFNKSYTWSGNSIALDHQLHKNLNQKCCSPRKWFQNQTFNNQSENLRFNSAFGIINTDDIVSTLQ